MSRRILNPIRLTFCSFYRDTQVVDVQLITLQSLREELKSLTRDNFLEQYRGAFLLAMGFLAVETIRARARNTNLVRDQNPDVTASISFGPRLRYDSPQTHPLAGCAFFLSPTASGVEVELGRDSSCEITIPDPSVSQCHCCIRVTERGVVVVDSNSTNGTAVNLERVPPGEERILADEDFLSVGRYSFQLLVAPTLYEELQLLAAVEDA